MAADVSDVKGDLEQHIKECGQRYELLRDEISDLREDLIEAAKARDELKKDVKQLLAVMHAGKGAMRALVVLGSILIASGTTFAWLWDHFPLLHGR